MSIRIIRDKCKGCQNCVPACPFGCITMIDKLAIINLEECKLCGACVPECPFEAIEMEIKEKKVRQDITQYKGIAVFAESRNNILQEVAKELISEARKLADKLDVEVIALLVGSTVTPLAESCAKYGADKIVYVQDNLLNKYSCEPFSRAVVNFVNKYKPEAMLFGASTMGRDLAARAAVQLETGLTADCTALNIDLEKKLEFIAI